MEITSTKETVTVLRWPFFFYRDEVIGIEGRERAPEARKRAMDGARQRAPRPGAPRQEAVGRRANPITSTKEKAADFSAAFLFARTTR
ncbi:MAG: hypothetical protein JNG85_09440 [Spirochaetaceae bacterium]|nr:hypothetical protein [Spirochaetaceae bacterium]